MPKKPCCEQIANLEDGTAEHGNGRSDLTVLVCRVCGARHFRLQVEPGRLGIRGGSLGPDPSPEPAVLGSFSHPSDQGVVWPVKVPTRG